MDSTRSDQPPVTPGAESRAWDQYQRRLFLAVGVVALLVVLAGFVQVTTGILLLLFLCGLIALGIRGISDLLTRHTPLGENVALALVVVLLVVLVVGVLLLVGPRLAAQFAQLGEALPDALESLQTELNKFWWGETLAAEIPSMRQLGELIGSGGGDIFARITGVVSSVLSLLSSVLVVIFVTLFLALEPQTYMRNFLRLIPPERRPRLEATLREVASTLKQWLLMRLVSMGVIGSLTFVGLSLIGTPLSLSLTMIAMIGAFIPTFGPIIALIPAVLVAFIQGPQPAVWVTVLYLGIQMIDNYLVSPILQKQMLYLPPAYIIVAQLFFGVLAGAFGLVLAAPLAAALVVIVRMLYVEDILGDHGNRYPADAESDPG